MRRILFSLFACMALASVLCGCSGKTVSIVDNAGFRNLADRYGSALKARQILDADGACVVPLVAMPGAVPDDAGDRLFRRLSPAFRFRNVDPALLPATFAASRAEGDTLDMWSHGFTLVQGLQRVRVDLLGLADWNDDGNDDWFVRCTVSAMKKEESRDYYLVITDPEAGIMRPEVIGVYDCRDRRCVNYAGGDCPSESSVVDLLAGQRVVTAPPGQGKMPEDPGRPLEQKLKN